MKKISAGLIMYWDFPNGERKYFAVHPGGPYFKNKDQWGFPKGIVEQNEEYLDAAKREFFEETGFKPMGPFTFIGITGSKRKDVLLWAFEGFHKGKIKSNTTEIEFHGKIITIPENDKGEWFTIQELEKKIFRSQKSIIPKIRELIK